VSLLVDTSVWSLALRRDTPPDTSSLQAAVSALRDALQRGDTIVTTGLILQELLQGVVQPRSRERIADQFSALPCLMPDRDDHAQAALLHTRCRQRGLQVGTIDALIAQLCIRHQLMLLTTDRDFAAISRLEPKLRLALPAH
jgi:predicted nucleic acid-binding protein